MDVIGPALQAINRPSPEGQDEHKELDTGKEAQLPPGPNGSPADALEPKERPTSA
jgi:hypothetical protein